MFEANRCENPSELFCDSASLKSGESQAPPEFWPGWKFVGAYGGAVGSGLTP